MFLFLFLAISQVGASYDDDRAMFLKSSDLGVQHCAFQVGRPTIIQRFPMYYTC